MRHTQHGRLALFLGVLVSTAAFAAPSTDASSAAELKPTTSAPLPTSAGRAWAPDSGSRAIDMLVEMHQPGAGIQFNERKAHSASAETGVRSALPPPVATQALPARRSQFEEAQTAPSGLFGSGATPAVQGRTLNASEPSSPRDGLPPRAAERSSSELPPELRRWLQWPRDVIEYVRDNRTFVVGGTALLLLLAWTGSMMFSRRRG